MAITFLPPAETDSQGVRRPARMRHVSAFPDDNLDQVFRYKVQDQFTGSAGRPTTLALADTRQVAEGAFRGACSEMPGRRIVLLDRASELKRQEHDPAAMDAAMRKRAGLAPS